MKVRSILIVCIVAMLNGYNQLWAQSTQNCPVQTECPLKKGKITPEQRMEKMAQQMKKRLLLDEATAAKFIPVYKEYLQALRACHTAIHSRKEQYKKDLTDAELDEYMQAKFTAQKQIIQTQETYYNKFKEILNIRQVEQLFKHTCVHKRHKAHKAHPHCNHKQKGTIKCHKHLQKHPVHQHSK